MAKYLGYLVILNVLKYLISNDVLVIFNKQKQNECIQLLVMLIHEIFNDKTTKIKLFYFMMTMNFLCNRKNECKYIHPYN